MENPLKDMTITVTVGTIVKVLVVLALTYVLFVMRDLVLVLLTAVVIASAIEPATQWFRKYKIPRLPAVVIIYLGVAVGLFGIFYLIVPTLVSDTINFISQVPQLVASLDISNSSFIRDVFNTPNIFEQFSDAFTLSDVTSQFRDILTSLRGSVLGTVSAIFGGAFSFGLIVVFSFYFAVQEKSIDRFLEVVTPYKHQRYIVDLWHRSQKKIGRWMQGQLILMLIIGVLVYLGLTVLGVRHAFLFAILAALFELIPLFGPVLASIPAIAIGFIDGGVTIGLIVAGLYIIIQQFENHLIYPLVVNKVVGVPPLLVIIALIVGGQVAGFLGVLLSVPLSAVLMEFTADIQAKNKKLAASEKTQT